MQPDEPSSAPNQPPVLEAEDHAVVEQEQSLFASVSDAVHLPRHRIQGLFWLVVLATSTLTGAIAFQWLTGLPPTPNCRKLFKATLSDSGQLYCADQATRKGSEASLSDALKLANSIDSTDPLFEQSRQLSDHWSQAILVLARKQVEAGDLKKGVVLAQKVPKTSSVYLEAQGMIKDWQGNWIQGEEIFKTARAAIQDQDWGKATEQVRNLVQIGSDYWQKKADAIVAEISIEQQAFYKISAAQELADDGSPDEIAKAIQTVSQIDSKRLAHQRVVEKIDEWSQTLVDIAKSAQENGDYEGVVKAAQKVPPNAKVANVAAAYLQMSRAATVAKDDSLWSSIQAYALSAQIGSDTPVYELSRTQRQAWQAQVQNWGQLAIAKWFASVDQRAGYRLAAEQAAMVQSDQPDRIEAQTLIAFWNKQTESFSERQFIARAKQLAVENTVASLEAAIAEADKLLSGERLRDTAQTLIAGWSDAVERVQDQPILNQAIALAQQGNLNGAIQIAEKIKSDRVLYPDAQDNIYRWVAQIQSVEDRPILSEAGALANEGRLSEAISRASEIGSNRAMYSEAQAQISDWVEQRRQIEEANRPQPEPESPPSDSSQDSPPTGAEPEQPPEENQSEAVDNSTSIDNGEQNGEQNSEPPPASGEENSTGN